MNTKWMRKGNVETMAPVPIASGATNEVGFVEDVDRFFERVRMPHASVTMPMRNTTNNRAKYFSTI